MNNRSASPYLAPGMIQLCALSLGLALILSGCAAVFVAGVGVGAYSYVSGILTRVYEAEYERSIAASLQVMDDLTIKSREESEEPKKTVIEGSRADDIPVTIAIEYVDDGWTQIGVRTGLIGINNLEASEQVHDQIAEQLSRGASRLGRAKPAQRKDPPPRAGPGETAARPVVQANEPAAPPPAAGAPTPRDRQEDLSLYSAAGRKSTFIYYRQSELAVPPEAHGALDQIAAYLERNPSATADIRGYTDSSGDSTANLNISRARAYKVRDYLIDRGIAGDRLTAEGFGETNFLESNRSERLRNLNRRVEIVVK